jgi:carbon monoxide dehydrogenase subunit G
VRAAFGHPEGPATQLALCHAPGMDLSVSQHVAAPAEALWGIVTNIANSPNTVSGIESVEILAGAEFGVGTRWRETRIMFGRAATEEMTVTEVDPGRSYTTVAGNSMARYVSVLTVEPEGPTRCLLTMTFRAEPTTLPGRVMSATLGRMMVGATRKALEADLADLATAAESAATS